MSGDIGIPFVLQLKDGVNAMHLTDFEGIAQSIENAHLYQYITNGNPSIEQSEHSVYIQPLTQVIDRNVQIIDNGVQIIDEREQNMTQNIIRTQQIIDNNIQVVESSRAVVNNKGQVVDNGLQMASTNCHILENRPNVDNRVRIVTSNGQLLRNDSQIVKNIQIADNNINILDTNGQIVDKNRKVVDNNIENSIKMETDLNDIETKGVNFIYEVVYPEQLNLKFRGLKRGRPKKIKIEEPELVKPIKSCKPAPKTRSGRVVRFPKHIEKDFKKAEFEETITENGESEIKAADFEQYEEPPTTPMEKDDRQEPQELKATKRTIAAQYRCPKCQKAYLGKTKMIQHIKKYPDHGPLPMPRNEHNFDVWNYLVDITQKCRPAQRGLKFCGELTNLLHNVLLLTSALFKEVEANKTFVEVDKVLGNAIGISPGQYKFNDSELYKDVTVLKLITNTDFFKPVSVSKDIVNEKKVKETKAVIIDGSDSKDNIREVKDGTDGAENVTAKVNCDKGDKSINKKDENMYFTSTATPADKNNKADIPTECQPVPEPNTKPVETIIEKDHKVSNVADDFNKKTLSTPLDGRVSVHQELLSENSLLHMPNLRTAVDDLMLATVDNGSALLDNSTSSDEVMNVDQFVNERFKKITEPELDISGGSLNLDLPPLDLFHFHTS